MRWLALALLLTAGTARADRVVVYTSVDEALQLAEHFREAARLPDATELASWLVDAAALAGSLEKALRRVPGDAAQRDELFRRVERSCRACHARFRD